MAQLNSVPISCNSDQLPQYKDPGTKTLKQMECNCFEDYLLKLCFFFLWKAKMFAVVKMYYLVSVRLTLVKVNGLSLPFSVH